MDRMSESTSRSARDIKAGLLSSIVIFQDGLISGFSSRKAAQIKVDEMETGQR
jgi:hypothetical protein